MFSKCIHGVIALTCPACKPRPRTVVHLPGQPEIRSRTRNELELEADQAGEAIDATDLFRNVISRLEASGRREAMSKGLA